MVIYGLQYKMEEDKALEIMHMDIKLVYNEWRGMKNIGYYC